MHRHWRRLLAVMTVVTVLVAVIASGGVQAATGAKVEIIRDPWGVPHIYANDPYSLFYGYGYAVAQDRLFQMEIAKRTFTGRLAEVLGPDYVHLDVATRRNFIPEMIEQQIQALGNEDRQILRGYVDGLNAYMGEVLKNPTTLLPREFTDFGFDPEPWDKYDLVMIFLGSMAFRYGDFNNELNNLALLRLLEEKHGKETGREIFSQLRWLEDPTAPTTTAGPQVSPGRQNLQRTGSFDYLKGNPQPVALAAGLLPLEVPTASNLIIVGKQRAGNGNAILLNGPQFGNFVPAYVYAVGLHGAGFEVVGNTPFAYPVLLFGHNQNIAWGSTAGPNDVVDIYEEQLHPTDPTRYFYRGAYRPMGKHTYTVQVKGSAPVTVEVFTTVHGIVIQTDAENRVAYSKKRSWTGREVRSMMAWVKSMQATSFQEWLGAAENYALPINWYYADRQGNIGYISNGLLPMRPANQPFNLPASGTGGMEWLGFHPVNQNPQVLNPGSGVVANWNNKPSPDFKNNDSWYFSRADRVNEIFSLLEGLPTVSAQDILDINRQISFANTDVRYFLSFLETAVQTLPEGSQERQAVQLIRQWYNRGHALLDADEDGFYDDPAVPIFQEWLQQLIRNTLGDELDGFKGPAAAYGSISRANAAMGAKVLHNALLGRTSGVPQTYDFFNGQDRNEAIRQALTETLAALAASQGAAMTEWRAQGQTHSFSTHNFVGAPQTNATRAFALPSFMNRGTENNLFVLGSTGIQGWDVTPPGQSGFVDPDGSPGPNYDNQVELYANFDLKPQYFTREEVDANAVTKAILTLP